MKKQADFEDMPVELYMMECFATCQVKDICFHHDPRTGELCPDSKCERLKVDPCQPQL